MKSAIVLLTVFVFIAPGCARHASAAPPVEPSRGRIDVTPPSVVPHGSGHAADDTAVNARDRNGHTLTPMDQSEKGRDLRVTRRIRRALIKDESLSVDGKNIKIITMDGKVTLRGPVKSEKERAKIVASAKRIAGAASVDDRLQVEHRR